MRMHPALIILLTIQITACSARGGAPRDPGSPTPVADPRSGAVGAGDAVSAAPASGHTDRRRVPVRADQAPLVHVRDALEDESLLGHRVRVAGRCTARGEGRRAGSWTLQQAGAAIEVRGLVPSSCAEQYGESLTIFAQIEPKAAGSPDRILLRLPD
jgi:hypothetical protein